MPILLDTPLVEPSEHGIPGETLTMVNLVDFRVKAEHKFASFKFEYGNYDMTDPENPKWIPSQLASSYTLILEDKEEITGVGMNPSTQQPEIQIIQPEKTDFTDAVAALLVDTPHVGFPFLNALGASLYAYVQTLKPEYAGTII